MNVSVPTAKLITQMNSVLQVSTVDLCAADAYFVMETPQALKEEIETMIPIDIPRRAGYVLNCWNARMEFSTKPESLQMPSL